MTEISSNNKRIAKNTFVLYLRTMFVMVVSLYTSRVILQTLGVEDYGIYQVVGGLVSMFSIISTSLSGAVSRFITFEIGRGRKERLERIFATSMLIQIGLCVIVVLAVEIIGIWFLHNEMQIPEGRMGAAQWVLHCSVITFCLNLLSVPYNACIIAHEHMKAFAYVSIVETILKLGVVYLIAISPVDSLILFAVLLVVLSAIIRLIYSIYCHRRFEESRAKIVFDKEIFKDMLGFSGWNFFNSTTYLLNTQGVNMLINVYYGVVLNAARGIASQVEGAVHRFVGNFTVAINPQITKSYAAGDLSSMHLLVCRGARFSYFAMLFLSLPLIMECKQILDIWLVDVPEYAVIFTQLSLIMSMCSAIGNSGYTACMATGKLKKYSIIISSIGLLEFPLAWLLFAYGASPVAAYYTYIVVRILVLIARMFLLESMVGLKVTMYMKQVFVPIILTTIVAILFPILLNYFMKQTLIRIPVMIAVTSVSVMLSVFYLGMSKNERNFIVEKIKVLVKRFIKK